MWRVRQSRKARYAKRNEIMGFSEIAGVVTVSAKKLTAFKQKQSQRLASHQHQTDGKALILLSSPLLICVLSNSRKFTVATASLRQTSNRRLAQYCQQVNLHPITSGSVRKDLGKLDLSKVQICSRRRDHKGSYYVLYTLICNELFSAIRCAFKGVVDQNSTHNHEK
jgi:hypothetical protein